MSRPTGILICLPIYGGMIRAETMETVYSTGQFLTRCGIPNQLAWFSAADISEVRNLFLTMWYDNYKQFSHMLFIDADMGFSPELIRDMIKFDQPLMGALYARREMTPSIVGTAPVGHTIKDVQHGFLPASAVGGGVMMIARKMVDEMLRQKPELSDKMPPYLRNAMARLGDGMPRILRMFDVIQTPDYRLSEDVSFCKRAQDAGFPIWANVRHKIDHIGTFNYFLSYESILKRKAQEAAEAVTELPTPMEFKYGNEDTPRADRPGPGEPRDTGAGAGAI